MFDLHTISFLLIFIAAGLVKGVTGMGLPTVAMGLLGLLMPPQAAAALLVLPSLLTNLWQLLAGPALAQIVRRLWLMMTGIIIGTLAGSSLLIGLNPRWSALLGMWLGQRIRSRLSPQRFRQGFLLFLLALGIELIARGWLV